MSAIKPNASNLRREVHRARARFMESIASGEDAETTAEQYADAVKRYRIAIFSEIRDFASTQGADLVL